MPLPRWSAPIQQQAPIGACLPTLFPAESLTSRGFHTVSRDALSLDGGYEMYYELHGGRANGSVEVEKGEKDRILFIMGLNNSCFAWQRQVEYFTRSSKYSALVLDNRGVGYSGTGSDLRYTTKGMASDVRELLEWVGWGEGGRINVVGISMGGMISQELALLIPHRVSSLSLLSTTSSNVFSRRPSSTIKPLTTNNNTSPQTKLPSLAGLAMFAKLTYGPLVGMQKRELADIIVQGLFPAKWLDGVEEQGGETISRRKLVGEEFLKRMNFSKPQSGRGKLGQFGAVLTHQLSADALAQLARTIPHIGILHGTEDSLISVTAAKQLFEGLTTSGSGSERVTLKIIDGGGHALPRQLGVEFDEWIEERIRCGKRAVASMVNGE